jgi:hypothetical protein
LSGVSTWRQDLVQEWCDNILPIYLAGLVETCEVREVVCVDEVPGTGADVVGDTHGIDIGQIVDDPVPPQVSGLLSWVSAQRGRSGRGRTYIPALPRGRLRSDGYRWTSAAEDYLADMVAFMLSYYGPTGSSSLARLVVISRQLDGSPQVPPVGYPVEDGSYSSVIATQRRRLER